MRDFLAFAADPRAVEFYIQFVNEKGLRFITYAPLRPRHLECVEPLSPTLCAGPVSCGKGCCLIQKEQLGIQPWTHNYTPSALELQLASDPGSALVLPDDFPLSVVQQATAISH